MFSRIFIRYKSKLIIGNDLMEKKITNIKNANYETKSLFGPIDKSNKTAKSKSKTKTKIVTNTPVAINTTLAQANSKSCERYWLVERKTEPIMVYQNSVKVKLSHRLKNQIIPPSLQLLQKNKLPSPLKNSTKMKEIPLNVEQTIPFSDDEVKLLPNFPLEILNEQRNTILALNKNEIKNFPSVTTVLQATMSETSRNALMKWKTIKIAELGDEGFAELQKTYLKNGKLFHAVIENYLKHKETPTEDSVVYATWKSINPIMEKIDGYQSTETYIYHPVLKYKGIIDSIVHIDDDLCIMEWKKSDRIKSGNTNLTYDAPIQLCAYLGAINSNPAFSELLIKKGGVVVAYTDGHPADFYKLNISELNKYWVAWLLRLQEYWIRYRDGTLPEPI